MKQSLQFILALLILASVTACASDVQPPAGSETGTESAAADTVETEAPDLLDGLGTRDFGGAVFTALDANDYPERHINIPGEEMSGDLVNDGLITRNRLIEERYNVSLVFDQIGNANEGTRTLRSSVLAGEDKYNLCFSMVCGGAMATLATDGVLQNLCDIPHLSLQKEWWSAYMYDSFMLGDRLYYTSGDISPVMYHSPTAVYLNKTLLDRYQIDTDFYSTVKSGKWTIDAMHAVTRGLAQDVNGDGIMHGDDDIFGMITQTNALSASIFLSGCDVSLYENDGQNLTLNLSDEHLAAALEKLQMLTEPIVYEDQTLIITDTYQNDRALALVHNIGTGLNFLRDMKSDYLIVPFPKYDEAQENYVSMSNGWMACFVAVPLGADPDFTGFVTEALAIESRQSIRPLMYDMVFKQKGARDEDSAAMLDIIINTVYLDFMEVYAFGGLTGNLADIIFNDAPWASAFESKRAATESAMTRFVESWKSIES